MKTDSDLQREIAEELEWNPTIRNETVAVAVRDGIVTLAGTVESYAQKLAAERAVEQVKGVRAIANDLTVKLTRATERLDPDIAKAAANALLWDVEVPENRISIKVSNGIVTLTGSVDSYYQKTAAERSVRYLTGVKGVVNHVVVQAGPAPAAVEKQIEDRLRRQAEIDAREITVEVTGQTVTLSGTVRSVAEKRDAEQAAYFTPGVTMVENQLLVEPFLPATL